jgi:hypothetical protein
MPPLAFVSPPAAEVLPLAALSDFFSAEGVLDAAAEPLDDPLPAGALELLLDCGCDADEPWLDCLSCFCCATAPNDSKAAATATTRVLNFMDSPFLETDRG